MNKPQKQKSLTSLIYILIIFMAVTLSATTLAQPTTYNEAPMLASRVAAGDLPPVEERLPVNPVVVPVVDRIGVYGGTWNSALLGGGDVPWLTRTMGYENLMRWTPDWEGMIPNIAESVDVNEDATVYTFSLREGMKWSDGHPFTADDIMFWYEDIFLNDELTLVRGSPWVSGDDNEPVVVTKIDDYTVQFTFSASSGLFLQNLATALDPALMAIRHPRHYLEQFHPTYNPEGLDALVRESGLNDWVSLMDNKADRWANPEIPTLNPWVVTLGYGQGTATRVLAERNPYYWKVDPEGNQLPYIDRLTFDVLSDAEVLVLKALNGEIDMQDRSLATVANRAILFDNQERGNYRFFTTTPTDSNRMTLMLNLNHKDPVLREIFLNKDFRIGLSYAMNRQDIIDGIWVGQGEPYQSAPRPESVFYNERLAKQYIEHDIALANEHLDKAVPERDAEGFRLRPDGQRLSFSVAFNSTNTAFGDALELIQLNWREVGIDMQIASLDRSLIQVRREAGELDGIAWERGGGGGQSVILDPRWYFPSNPDSRNWAPAWTNWYLNVSATGQAAPEEPSAAARRQIDLYEQLSATADQDRQVELMNEILEIAADEFWVMGISLEGDGYGIVKNNFHNVPEVMPASWVYPTPGPTNPAQYFISSSND